jgi:putative membrane protein
MTRVNIWTVALAAALAGACAGDTRDDTTLDQTAPDTAATAPGGMGSTAGPRGDVGAPAGTGGAAMAAASDDRAFVQHMGAAGVAEVKLGELAAERAASQDVKQFAHRMVIDHGKANDELKPVASQMNVELPDALDAEHQALYDKLSKLRGAEFDREYMAAMVEGHRKVASEIERHADGSTAGRGVGTTGETAASGHAGGWASRTLPVVREHLDQATDINGRLTRR